MRRSGTQNKRRKALTKALIWLSGAALTLLIGAMAFVVIGPRFGWRVDTVLSGSMEPAFGAGDAVVIQGIDPTRVKVGDIITYRASDDSSMLVTHRVVEIAGGSRLTFTTKGDANEEIDNYNVPAQNVIGVVKLSLPLVGYFANFAKTRTGLLVLLIIPGALVIGNEMRRIWVALSEMETKRKQANLSDGG